MNSTGNKSMITFNSIFNTLDVSVVALLRLSVAPRKHGLNCVHVDGETFYTLNFKI